jgi:mRNA-degrading endonuclease RelE of RelBE toxin-antitoxin system
MNRFNSLPEFQRECKRLIKKYRSLHDDIEKLQEILLLKPTGIGSNFTMIHTVNAVKIIKARMASRALRDRSLRVIYGYNDKKKTITFIELYYKGEKENEDRRRIEEYLTNYT